MTLLDSDLLDEVGKFARTPTPANKLDAGKNRLDLLDPFALEEIGRALTHGAQKYGEHNWRRGLAYSRLYAAALRHLFAWWRGEELDSETGLSHLAHAGCCVMFLLSYRVSTERGIDDRWSPSGPA